MGGYHRFETVFLDSIYTVSILGISICLSVCLSVSLLKKNSVSIYVYYYYAMILKGPVAECWLVLALGQCHMITPYEHESVTQLTALN
jgi:hypothetical protein